mmetsp:Transcript_56641/g.100973  ORF Transcript_56641/g.100973 Transcript_56641/m.100973 type:complete len:269 (+) Transcript_56641:2776-3582(+)
MVARASDVKLVSSRVANASCCSSGVALLVARFSHEYTPTCAELPTFVGVQVGRSNSRTAIAHISCLGAVFATTVGRSQGMSTAPSCIIMAPSGQLTALGPTRNWTCALLGFPMTLSITMPIRVAVWHTLSRVPASAVGRSALTWAWALEHRVVVAAAHLCTSSVQFRSFARGMNAPMRSMLVPAGIGGVSSLPLAVKMSVMMALQIDGLELPMKRYSVPFIWYTIWLPWRPHGSVKKLPAPDAPCTAALPPLTHFTYSCMNRVLPNPV